jgi:gas vesicle protein GvpL/GvpF
MDYLLYCVTDVRDVEYTQHNADYTSINLFHYLYQGALILNPADIAIELAVEGELACVLGNLYSAKPAEPLDFYFTVSCVLETAAALPFRFPTIIRHDDLTTIVLQVRALLRENAQTFSYLLAQFKNHLQIDLRIVDMQEIAPPASGTAYLEAARDRSRRMLETANELRTFMDGLHSDWKMRDVREEVRCSVLVERNKVLDFNQRIGAYANNRCAKVIVSRPWAPTGFMSVPELTLPQASGV